MLTGRTLRNRLFHWITLAALMPATLVSISAVGDEKPPPAQGPSDVEKAKAIIERAAKRYRALKSYQDKITMRFTMIAKDEDGDDAGQEQEQDGSLAFVRPNRIALKTDQASVLCDGKKLWVRIDMLGQYTEADAPAKPDLGDLFPQQMAAMLPTHPVAMVLSRPDKPVFELFDGLTITGSRAEKRDERTGQLVLGTIEIDVMPFDGGLPITLWFDDEQHLLRELHIDMTEAYKDMMGAGEEEEEEEEDDEEDLAFMKPPKIEKAEVVIIFDDIRLDADIPDERFAFKPDDGDEKVKEFEMFGPDASEQLALVGEPAPDFEGRDLDDKPLKLSDLKGRVVVLDFWATWCGPCVQAIPHVQKIADKFADKPVTVLGINRDAEGTEKKIRKFLRKKKITFRQFMDAEGDVAEKYKVTGIPCTALIDMKGVVQDIHTGFSPGMEEDIIENIEALLAGKTIYDAEEVAERRKRAEEGGADEGQETVVSAAGLQEFARDRLVEQPKLRVMSAGQMIRRFDVDGDGRSELLLPDWQGTLNIVSADGADVERVRFKKAKGYRSLTAFEPVRIGGQLHWLTVRTKHTGMSQHSRVVLYDRGGEPVWTFEPEVPKKTSCTMMVAGGDLDGDGIVEFVVGLSAYQLEKFRRDAWSPSKQRGYLVVLGPDGARLCQRKVGQHVSFVHVAPAAEKGQPAMILCGLTDRVRRFQYKGETLAALEPSAEEAAIAKKNDGG